jgi:hypothetical protein
MGNAILHELLRVLDEDRALAVIDHRKVTIKKPLTVHAAKLLAKRLAAWGDANAAADLMIERCWQGFDASWVRDRSPPRRPPANSVVDAMNDIFRERGWSNEPECIPGDNGHDQRFPAERNGQESAVVDLREGADWNWGSRHH